MYSPTRVTYSNVAAADAMVTCARDLRAILERRTGVLDGCEVHVDRLTDAQTSGECFRVKLHVIAAPYDVQLTMVPQTDMYMALSETFDRAAWLLPRLREMSSPTLLRKLRTIAAEAMRNDSRRYRLNRPALSGDEVRLS